MNTTTLIGLVNNAALLLALGLLYDTIALKRQSENPSAQVLIGVIFGAMGIAVMMNPWEFTPGVIFDTRSVLLSVGGLFFGFIPTLVAVLMTGVYRLYQGGTGAWTGVAVIITSGVIGVGWRHLRRNGLKEISSLELYVLGIVVHVAMLLWMLSLPWSLAIGVLSKISLPVMIVHPVGTALLGKLMTNRLTRKQAEEERERLLVQIQEQARQMQQIVDTVPEGVLLLDADGRVMLANPVAEKDLAVLAGAKVGDTLTHLGDRSLAELLTSPPTKGLWHETKVGTRTFEVIARPMENGPEPEDWVLVINDVTQERETQRRIQQQERLAAVGQLAAGIAHDFNNIMATIVLYAQMMARDEELSTRVRERMETINQQTKYATLLIQQILDFSRRAMLERRPLDLGLLLKEQVKLLERTLPESIEIKLAYGPDEYTVNADPTRMQQAITNLAVNARDAMPEGGELRFGLERIRIEERKAAPLPEMRAGEWVQMTVSDTGTGIPPDALPHIFEPFFTTRAPLGSGLGLAQVHGSVAQHEGYIDVETQLGQGTTFTIYLPALPAHQPEPPTRRAMRLIQGEGQTILVVEDNAATRGALAESLKLLNYRVLEAANGQEALTIFERHTWQVSEDFPSLEEGEGRIALVLSDLVMPKMGGQALFQALRQQYPTVKVVLLTGHPLEKELENLQAQGLSGWLLKPPSLERLAEVVARALNLCSIQD